MGDTSDGGAGQPAHGDAWTIARDVMTRHATNGVPVLGLPEINIGRRNTNKIHAGEMKDADMEQNENWTIGETDDVIHVKEIQSAMKACP